MFAVLIGLSGIAGFLLFIVAVILEVSGLAGWALEFLVLLILALIPIAGVITVGCQLRHLAKAIRDLHQQIALHYLVLFALLLPCYGVLVARYLQLDPTAAFYSASVQVLAALAIAVTVNARFPAPRANEVDRERIAIVLGQAFSVVVALVASLAAVGRDDGSEFLFGLVAGGVTAALFLLLISLGLAISREVEG